MCGVSYGAEKSAPAQPMKNTLVDCRGLKCPMPIVKTRLALNALHKDDELVILADDPTFSTEFQRFCYLADISLITKTEKDDETGKVQIYHVKVIK